jgi:hypothetical protein
MGIREAYSARVRHIFRDASYAGLVHTGPGGAISIGSNGFATFSSVTLSKNIAQPSGGAIRFGDHVSAVFSFVTLSENTAVYDGHLETDQEGTPSVRGGAMVFGSDAVAAFSFVDFFSNRIVEVGTCDVPSADCQGTVASSIDYQGRPWGL